MVRFVASCIDEGFAQNLGSWMEPYASPMVDFPSSSQRNSNVNTVLFNSKGYVGAMVAMEVSIRKDTMQNICKIFMKVIVMA